MEIVVAGLNHRTAPVEIRELASMNAAEAASAVRAFVSTSPGREALVISTCNRTEMYAVSEDGKEAADLVLKAAAAVKPGLALVDSSRMRVLAGREAVLHLLRTACGLDSQVLGEDEIAGQVRDAFEISFGAGGMGPVMERLRAAALAVCGRVKSETGLSRGAVSVSSAAVDLARKVFRKLEDKSALVIGAGHMARLACCCLKSAGTGRIAIANRSAGRAESLAREVGGVAGPLESVESAVRGASIVISAVGGGALVLTRAQIESASAAGSAPSLLIDISVPRSIDPSAGGLDSVFLKTIDDLNTIVMHNLENRTKEAPAAERIALEEASRFESWLSGRDADAAVAMLAERLDAVRRSEIARTMKGRDGLREEDLDRLTRSILDKVLYRPASVLRSMKNRGADFDRCLDLFKEMFGLDGWSEKKD